MNCVKLASLYKISLDELVNKPLWAAEEEEFCSEDGKICGVIEVRDEGYIRIPAQVMEMFEIQIVDKVMLLADKRRGIVGCF